MVTEGGREDWLARAWWLAEGGGSEVAVGWNIWGGGGEKRDDGWIDLID